MLEVLDTLSARSECRVQHAALGNLAEHLEALEMCYQRQLEVLLSVPAAPPMRVPEKRDCSVRRRDPLDEQDLQVIVQPRARSRVQMWQGR